MLSQEAQTGASKEIAEGTAATGTALEEKRTDVVPAVWSRRS